MDKTTTKSVAHHGEGALPIIWSPPLSDAAQEHEWQEPLPNGEREVTPQHFNVASLSLAPTRSTFDQGAVPKLQPSIQPTQDPGSRPGDVENTNQPKSPGSRPGEG